MLRLLIRDLTVVKGSEPKLLQLQIRWQGGATETIEVLQRPNRAEVVRYPDEFIAKIRALAESYDDHEIVANLYEVYYARCVGIPNGRVPVLPGPLGISTRRTGGAR